MPTDLTKLMSTLDEMHQIYKKDPTHAVRSQTFINPLHDICVYELNRVGFGSKYTVKKEAKIFGSHKNKDVDVAVFDPVNGPQVLIGIRSQMSSVSKNILTYYEEIIGDCISLHDRFPMAVVCYVYLLPKVAMLGKPVQTDLARAEELFLQITNRTHWHSPKDCYEHFAFLKVDFKSTPIRLLETLPELEIINFFDNIKATYNGRNIFNKI